MNTPEFEDVDGYIALQPKAVQKLLTTLRTTIRKAAPKAEEGIAYRMPAYKLNGKPLVYFAAFAKHIGLYATPSANVAFAKELTAYKTSKGAIQLPVDAPLPVALVTKIVKFKAAEVASSVKPRAARPAATKAAPRR